MRRCFSSGDTKTLVWAFKVFVRPLLEYASPVWSPHLAKDIDLVESVQRHFTKYLPGLRNRSYKERLQLLNLESLEARRLKCDLGLTYSLLHGLVGVDYQLLFSIRGCERTRGHPLKLTVNLSKSNSRKYFFSNRIVSVWNSLPVDVVMAVSLAAFKKKLLTCDLSKYLRWN